jgi:uncharacterized protein (TIGR02594 family)
MPVPANSAYSWLNNEPGPKMLVEAIKLFGVTEGPGPKNNPTILAWATELKLELTASSYANWVADWYSASGDVVAWCGLFCAVIAKRSNPQHRRDRQPPEKFMAALEWANWGIAMNHYEAMLGDVLVFKRPGGGHVGLYVAEDEDTFHVLGGNTSDSVSIARIHRNRLYAVRRPAYINQPANVRKIKVAPTGKISTNEA